MTTNEDRQFASGLGRLMAGVGGRNYCYFKHTNDPDQTLAYVHYSDPRFDYPGSIIYGPRDAEGLTWVDSWNLPRDEEVQRKVQESLDLPENCPLTARYIETALRIRFDQPQLELVAVRGFSDPESGYGHYVYGYRIPYTGETERLG